PSPHSNRRPRRGAQPRPRPIVPPRARPRESRAQRSTRALAPRIQGREARERARRPGVRPGRGRPSASGKRRRSPMSLGRTGEGYPSPSPNRPQELRSRPSHQESLVDANTLLTYGFLAVVALVAQAADRRCTDPAAPARPRGTLGLQDVARLLVVFVVIYAMLLGGTEIADRGRGGGSVVDGALQIVAGGISLALILTGWDRIPGLRGLRPRAPISWLALA